MTYHHYYVNDTAQSGSGDHEVHKESCQYFDKIKYRSYLGYFDNCKDAVDEAKKKYPFTANGCYWCSLPCHTG